MLHNGVFLSCLGDSRTIIYDLVVFTSATDAALMGLKNVLDKFYSASGLSVSFGKSELFSCGISLEMKSQLASIIGLQQSSLPVRYLGVPLSCKKLSVADCQALLDKITSCITSWAARCLSYAGRLQLIDLVLSSLYGYWCSTFLLPKHLIKSVERLCSSFS